MSSIFLNYSDVRRLVSTLGEHRPTDDSLSCVSIVAAGLDAGRGLLLNGLQEPTPSEGSGIGMSWEQYAALCSEMRSQDLTALRHTDRLAVVARCLGWRADAMMHHLKTTTGKSGSNPSLRYEIDFLGNFSKLAGAERLERWRSLVRSGPGLFVVTGRSGNGIAHTYSASILLVGTISTVDQNRDVIVGEADGSGERIYGKAIRSNEDLLVCNELAANSTVIATFSSRGISDALSRLVRMSEEAGCSLMSLKGMLHQTLRREDGDWRAEMKIADPEGIRLGLFGTP
jgi:hypothetical protein|nr:hypothetical protein [Neorhizobium tomejilense]